MNREIKFRVWDGNKFLKSYANKGESFVYPSKSGFVGIDWFIQCQRLESPQRFWVQQFTGLYDKNKKEIYEGDIISYSMQGYKQTNPTNVNFIDIHLSINDRDPYSKIDLCSIEVIGNIFEDKELYYDKNAFI
jgi:hypothetical protein